MKYKAPIIDRSLADIAARTSKAFFNASDWQRVYGNAEITNALVAYLTKVSIQFDIIPDATIATVPTVSELNALLANIERIRVSAGFPAINGLVEIKDDWAAGSAATAPDYLDANDWERVLDILISTIGSLTEYVVYCGVSAAGQPRFYQHRFRQYDWVQAAETPLRRARTNVAVTGAGLTRNNGYRRY